MMSRKQKRVWRDEAFEEKKKGTAEVLLFWANFLFLLGLSGEPLLCCHHHSKYL